MDANQDTDILEEFKVESKKLLPMLVDILDEVEDDPSLAFKLEEYGQTVDRIMGGAKSLALAFPPDHFIHKVGDYSNLCKAVGYKASQIQNNEQFLNICVALLQDATEMLEEMILKLGENHVKMNDFLNKTFLDRLNWVSGQFSAEYRATVGSKPTAAKMSQNDIDDLLKKLGI